MPEPSLHEACARHPGFGEKSAGPAILLSGFFFAVLLFVTAHHEMWRDEIQAWLLARESDSLSDLFRNMRYEGHPALWHICLKLVMAVHPSLTSMRILHVLIATGTVYLIGRWSPFTWYQKVLLAFGYLFVFEYAVICRNYSLAVFFAVLTCSLHYTRFEKPVSFAVALFFLCQTCIHGLIIAIAVVAADVARLVVGRGVVGTGALGMKSRRAVALLIILAGMAVSVLQMKPPGDSGYATRWKFSFSEERLGDTLGHLTQAYIAIPEPRLNFWHSNILDGVPEGRLIKICLAFWIISGCILAFAERSHVILLFVGATFGLLAFDYVKHSGGMRHHGFLFVVFIMCAWIQSDPRSGDPGGEPAPSCRRGWFHHLICLCLFVHLVGGAIAVCIDIQQPFSRAADVARYILEHDLEHLPIVADPDPSCSGVLGHLPGSEAYYLRGRRKGTFVIWDRRRLGAAGDDFSGSSIVRAACDQGPEVLVILDRTLTGQSSPEFTVEKLKRFSGAIEGSENFRLYLVRCSRQAGNPR